ncbi:MAG: hypothetical protein AAF997_00435 [Myxococcota bacterium]
MAPRSLGRSIPPRLAPWKLALSEAFVDTRTSLRALVPLLLAAIVGLMTADAGFVYDDRSAILESPVVQGEVPFWEAFVRDYWGRPASEGVNSWRPVMPMVWAMLPSSPVAYHLLSVLLHVLATGLAFRLSLVLRPSEPWALSVASLFAVHPLHAEAVGAIVAQSDLLSFSLVLVACLLALKPVTPGRGVAIGWALLCAAVVKESAVIFAPLLVALVALQDEPRRVRILGALPTGIVTLGVVGFQLSLPRRDAVAGWGNTLAHYVDGADRVLLGLHNVGRAVAMSFWPHPLAPSHGYAAIDPSWGTLGPMALVGAVLLAVGVTAGVWALRRCRLDWICAVAFVYAPALLQSHWFVRLITDLAERLLYPAALGASMMVSAFLFAAIDRLPLRRVAFAVLVVSGLLLGVPARRAWISGEALWSHGVLTEPKAMRHHYNLSSALLLRDTDDAQTLSAAAYHRLIAIYLVNRFPEPADWEPIDALDAFPLEDRFVELPEALYPDQPCRVVVAFLRQNESLVALRGHVLSRWAKRYPGCFRRSESP